MQKLTRYYITKSGEEPTVHSVKVALGAAEPEERAAQNPPVAVDVSPPRETPGQPERARVGRLVKIAMRKRSRKP